MLKQSRILAHRFKGQALKASAWPQLMRNGLMYSMMQITGRDFHPSKPLVLMVEPSSRCNLSCPLCATGAGEIKRDPSEMDFDLFKKMIDAYSSHIIYILLFNQGEPFLNRDFLNFASYSHDQGIYTITSTNGHYIRNEDEAGEIIRSGLDEIIISLDGLTADTYSKYRIGGDFNRVIAGIRNLVQVKERLKSFTPIIELQMLLTAHTEAQLPQVREFGKRLGVDIVSVKTLQLLDTERDLGFLPRGKELRRYENEGEKLRVSGSRRNRCGRLYYSMNINSDGSIVPCCFDKKGKYVFGNIANGGIIEAWTGDKFRAFRKRILQNRTAINICTNCTEGSDHIYFGKWYIS